MHDNNKHYTHLSQEEREEISKMLYATYNL